MLFGISGHERSLLLCTYTTRSHQASKFIGKNQLFKFLVLSYGLCCGPRKFKKNDETTQGYFNIAIY